MIARPESGSPGKELSGEGFVDHGNGWTLGCVCPIVDLFVRRGQSCLAAFQNHPGVTRFTMTRSLRRTGQFAERPR